MPLSTAQSWFRRYSGGDHPALRLVCFPYAGGAASLFRGWGSRLPDGVELLAVQYPGREDRRREELIGDMDELLDRLCGAWAELPEVPCAFFGHSMGAMVAYELATRLERMTGQGPVHLFVSAAHAPGTGSVPTEAPPEELAEHIDRYFGGLPAEVRDDRAWVRQLTLLLAADFALYRSYRPRSGAPWRLGAAITGFAGDQDQVVPAADMASWADRTVAGFELRNEPGAHLFIREGWAPVVDAVSAVLRPRLLG
ncbi:thioesterase II family protein [Actinacidiphila glaucinigra]|uniref:thioesterase II family protein n=1 Tax=Actinacidiphila glaucinigra TaxID=235986 RepID=UPI003670C985